MTFNIVHKPSPIIHKTDYIRLNLRSHNTLVRALWRINTRNKGFWSLFSAVFPLKAPRQITRRPLRNSATLPTKTRRVRKWSCSKSDYRTYLTPVLRFSRTEVVSKSNTTGLESCSFALCSCTTSLPGQLSRSHGVTSTSELSFLFDQVVQTESDADYGYSIHRFLGRLRGI